MQAKHGPPGYALSVGQRQADDRIRYFLACARPQCPFMMQEYGDYDGFCCADCRRRTAVTAQYDAARWRKRRHHPGCPHVLAPPGAVRAGALVTSTAWVGHPHVVSTPGDGDEEGSASGVGPASSSGIGHDIAPATGLASRTHPMVPGMGIEQGGKRRPPLPNK